MVNGEYTTVGEAISERAIMISKELLSLVLGYEVLKINYSQDNELGYVRQGNPFCTLNLDTLGRRCKEWCATHGYNVSSNLVASMLTSKGTRRIFDGEELETILEATNYVAKKKGQL